MDFQQDSTPEYSYDAFLSFRGEDFVSEDCGVVSFRDGFADTVCERFRQAGIRTFRDSDDVNKAKKFDTEIKKAIERSKIVVFLFTKNFASSIFCLTEVSLFMERWRKNEAEVLPVFYMVEPDAGWAKDGGLYSDAFKKHEQEFKSRFQREKAELEQKRCELQEIRFQGQMQKLKAAYEKSLLALDKWKTDLGEVAEITGHPRHAEITGHPPEATNNRRYIFKGDWSVETFISIVVEDAWRLAKPVIFDVPRKVFGREDIISGLESWVKTEQPEKRITLLHGIKGIGKGTIAAVVSKANYQLFEAVAFVGKVEENCKQPDGVRKLQEQLCKRIRNSKSIETFLSDEQGRRCLKAALNDKRVLIVLKDLDTEAYFCDLMGVPGAIDRKVKVIVTSGNQNLLPDNSSVKFYVGPLTKEPSLELLQWKAHQWDPNFAVDARLVEDALESCGRVPFLIKSLPALLKAGKDALSTELPRIYQILQKTRFESLEKDDKDLFLDIACFYADREYDHVKSALNNWHWGLRSVAGFERLQGLHMVSVNGNSRVSMDQLEKDMGRRMVCQKAESTLHRQSHIWSPEDASKLLTRCNGTWRTRSFILDPKLVEISASTNKMMEYKSQAFAGLTELQLVQLVGVKLQGDYEGFPDGLVWLSWEGVPLHPMPNDKSWEYLLSTDYCNDNLQNFLDQRRSLKKLKILNLSCCNSFEKTPDFTRLEVPNLERLIMENCILLKEIHPSIQQLAKLVQLNLRGCRSLEELLVLGSSVKVLDISLCTGIRLMPTGRIESVEELRADHIEVDQLLEEQADFSFSAVFPSLVKLSLVGSYKQSFGTIVSDLVTLASLKYVDKELFPALSEAVGPSISLCVLS